MDVLMQGWIPYVVPEPRVSVLPTQLDAAIVLVRKLPCTDYRCKNASASGTRVCDRCAAIAALDAIVRQPI